MCEPPLLPHFSNLSEIAFLHAHDQLCHRSPPAFLLPGKAFPCRVVVLLISSELSLAFSICTRFTQITFHLRIHTQFIYLFIFWSFHPSITFFSVIPYLFSFVPRRDTSRHAFSNPFSTYFKYLSDFPLFINKCFAPPFLPFRSPARCFTWRRQGFTFILLSSTFAAALPYQSFFLILSPVDDDFTCLCPQQICTLLYTHLRRVERFMHLSHRCYACVAHIHQRVERM